MASATKRDITNYREPHEVTYYHFADPTKRPIAHAHAWGGWLWRGEDEYRYHTDSFGQGLWVEYTPGAGWQQIAGTMQFSLPANRAAALRRLARLKSQQGFSGYPRLRRTD
jgi:hypothetical protein